MKTAGFVARVSCENKRAYGSWAEAEKVARRMRQQTDELVGPYLCKHGCGMFHVGHSHEEIRRDERRKFEKRRSRHKFKSGNQPRHDGTNPSLKEQHV